jgi:uncharacterized protein
MDKFRVTDKTTISRLAKRGSYDKQTVFSILDEALFVNLAYVNENMPFQIPTGHCRINDYLYVHGSVGSGYMRYLAASQAPSSGLHKRDIDRRTGASAIGIPPFSKLQICGHLFKT